MATSRTSQVSKVAPGLYESLPLPAGSRCIRALDVVRLSENAGHPLQYDLRIIDLDSEPSPSFTALSYAWGSQTLDSGVITCGSFTLPITQNCHCALQHLTEVFGRLTIWIDAICINQDDEDEKMRQILLMQDIYSRAETVYVWLGESNVSTDRAMGYLENAGYLKHFFLDDLEELLTRDWINRIWTFQEIVLASNPVI
ncbi:HET-domain-containing protein, partial [Mytilinidion resinicola]